MAGHSKWANIKRKKEANDKAKGYVFAKLARMISLAVHEAGGITNPEANFKLRVVIDKARQMNMPKENIERAIEKGSREDQSMLQEMIYEVFAPHGVLLIVHCTTNNPTRTIHELRSKIESRGGKVGNPGSVIYLFDHLVYVVFNRDQLSESTVLTVAENLQALDIKEEGNKYIFYLAFEHFGTISKALGGLEPKKIGVVYKPKNPISIVGEHEDELARFISAIEEVEDVQEIFTNYMDDLI